MESSSLSSSSYPKANFLSIPLELRLEIYTYLLVLPPPPRPSPVYRSSPSPPRSPTPSSPKYRTAIILACRQTRFEAQPLLYKLNTFKADPILLTALPSPLVESKYIPLIRNWSIKVHLDPQPSHYSQQKPQPIWDSAALSAAFSNSRSLTITLWQSTFMGGVGIGPTLAKFESVRGVRGPIRIEGMMPGFGRYIGWLASQMRKPEGVGIGETYEPEDEWEARRLAGWS